MALFYASNILTKITCGEREERFSRRKSLPWSAQLPLSAGGNITEHHELELSSSYIGSCSSDKGREGVVALLILIPREGEDSRDANIYLSRTKRRSKAGVLPG